MKNSFFEKYKGKCSTKILRLFLAKIKNISYNDIMFHRDEITFSQDEINQLENFVERYEQQEPISKILNRREFWTSEFFVNENVLDPRPETEIIIERSLSLFDKDQKFNFLDLGTGSGCILLSIAKEFSNSFGIGIDISEEAVTVAKINRKKLQLKNVEIKNINWNEFSSEIKFDLIVSNPPYIRSEDIKNLDENVKNFDPILALDGGASGLDSYKQISDFVGNLLNPNGILLLEIGINQFDHVKNIFEKKDFCLKKTHFDFQKIPRILEFEFIKKS